MAAILEGVRVISWTVGATGPMAATILGDMGADVIKVEDPGRGDMARTLTRLQGVDMTMPGGGSLVWEKNNRNARGIAVDLKAEKGRAVMYRLVEKADVLIQNYRAGAAERIGMDYATLSELNPRLVYASSTGFGRRGPYTNRPNLDAITLAASGNMTFYGDADSEPINNAGMADQAGAVWLAFGAVAALLARERLGIGQEVSSSGLGSMLNLQSFALLANVATGQPRRHESRHEAPNPLMNWYRCKDGRWILLSLVQADRYWPVFCRAMDLAELERDARFESTSARETHRRELIEILDARFAGHSYEEWDRKFQAAGDLLYARVNHIEDLATDPQVLANDYLTEWDHPRFGPIRVPGFPLEFSETPQTLRRAAPELGEHTQEILMEHGYTAEEVRALTAEGVIR